MQDRSKGRSLQLAKFVYGFIAYSRWLINFELAPLIERWLGRLQDSRTHSESDACNVAVCNATKLTAASSLGNRFTSKVIDILSGGK